MSAGPLLPLRGLDGCLLPLIGLADFRLFRPPCRFPYSCSATSLDRSSGRRLAKHTVDVHSSASAFSLSPPSLAHQLPLPTTAPCLSYASSLAWPALYQ